MPCSILPFVDESHIVQSIQTIILNVSNLILLVQHTVLRLSCVLEL